jgi:hypothetical protein
LNPAHAGCKIALDSRFLSLSNNDLVDAWSARSPASLSPTASGGVRPTYLTNILNGNPAIRFLGGQDFTNTTESLSGARTVIGVAANRRTSLSGNFLDPVVAAGWAGNGGVGWFEATSFNGFSSATQRRVQFGSDNRKNGSTSSTDLNLNEYFIGSGNSTQTITVAGFVIGAQRTSNGVIPNGFRSLSDILLVAVAQPQLSRDLIRRIEHAAAFSFKIACN